MKMCKGLFISLAFTVCCLGGYEARGLTFLVTQTNDSTAETSLASAFIKKIRVRGAVIEQPSLRGAIIAANRRGGFNTILIQPKTYQLSLGGAGEDDARSGDLDITRGHLIIVVVGNGNAIINATGLGDRIFEVFADANLTLSHLMITGGTEGAIRNAGTVTLKNCSAIGNRIVNDGYFTGNAGGFAGGKGGGIYSSGKLTMANCLIAGNSSGDGSGDAPGGDGGGIFNAGRLFATSCVFVRNSSGNGGLAVQINSGGSGGNGGGIYNSGVLMLKDCNVSRNFSGLGRDSLNFGFRGGSGGNGGGVYNAGQLRLIGCIVSGNANGNGGKGAIGNSQSIIIATTGGKGGEGGNGAGIYNRGTLDVNTCTISSNTNGSGGDGHTGFPYGGQGGNGGSGGGIFNSGSLSVISSAVSFNTCGAGGMGGTGQQFLLGGGQVIVGGNGGDGGNGGGIFEASTNILALIDNTLIALNWTFEGGAGGPAMISFPPSQPVLQSGLAGHNGVGFDIFGDFKSHGFNLISASDGSTGFTNGANADQVGSIAAPIDPLIGPLQMNGGPTPTHALLPGSPAIDQGKNFGQGTDQRGHHRPHDYSSVPNAPGGDGSDIGAFELDH